MRDMWDVGRDGDDAQPGEPSRGTAPRPASGSAAGRPRQGGREATCVECHQLGLITRSRGYTEEGWRDLISSMVDLSPPEGAAVATYLAMHFPVTPP